MRQLERWCAPLNLPPFLSLYLKFYACMHMQARRPRLCASLYVTWALPSLLQVAAALSDAQSLSLKLSAEAGDDIKQIARLSQSVSDCAVNISKKLDPISGCAADISKKLDRLLLAADSADKVIYLSRYQVMHLYGMCAYVHTYLMFALFCWETFASKQVAVRQTIQWAITNADIFSFKYNTKPGNNYCYGHNQYDSTSVVRNVLGNFIRDWGFVLSNECYYFEQTSSNANAEQERALFRDKLALQIEKLLGTKPRVIKQEGGAWAIFRV